MNFSLWRQKSVFYIKQFAAKVGPWFANMKQNITGGFRSFVAKGSGSTGGFLKVGMYTILVVVGVSAIFISGRMSVDKNLHLPHIPETKTTQTAHNNTGASSSVVMQLSKQPTQVEENPPESRVATTMSDSLNQIRMLVQEIILSDETIDMVAEAVAQKLGGSQEPIVSEGDDTPVVAVVRDISTTSSLAPQPVSRYTREPEWIPEMKKQVIDKYALAELIKNSQWPKELHVPVFKRILCESGGNAHAVTNEPNSKGHQQSVGLLQIKGSHVEGGLVSSSGRAMLLSPEYNLWAGYQLFMHSGQTWKDWAGSNSCVATGGKNGQPLWFPYLPENNYFGLL